MVTNRFPMNTRRKQDNTGIKRLCHRKGRITGIIDSTDAAKIPYVFSHKRQNNPNNYIKEEHSGLNRWCHRVCALPNYSKQIQSVSQAVLLLGSSTPAKKRECISIILRNTATQSPEFQHITHIKTIWDHWKQEY